MLKKLVATHLKERTIEEICEENEHCFALCIYLCLAKKHTNKHDELYEKIKSITRCHDAALEVHSKYFKDEYTPDLDFLTGVHLIIDNIIPLDEFSTSLNDVELEKKQIFVINYKKDDEELAHSIIIDQLELDRYLCFDPVKRPYLIEYTSLEEIKQEHIERYTKDGSTLQDIRKLTFYNKPSYETPKKKPRLE